MSLTELRQLCVWEIDALWVQREHELAELAEREKKARKQMGGNADG